jgi:hypothetical protein
MGRDPFSGDVVRLQNKTNQPPFADESAIGGFFLMPIQKKTASMFFTSSAGPPRLIAVAEQRLQCQARFVVAMLL